MRQDVSSIKSRRLSIGDTISIPHQLRQKYAIHNAKYMIIGQTLDWETYPYVIITSDGAAFFFEDYEVIK